MANFADFQLGTYLAGLEGTVPDLPFSAAAWEDRAREVWDAGLYDYVAGGAGDERTQRANGAAFDAWRIVPRMLAGAATRDLSVELFGHRHPSPLFMSPIGVLGVMTPDQHGDMAGARAAAETGVAFTGSTLMQDPLEEVAGQLGTTPGFFQLYTPADRELAESLVHRAEAAGWSALVVTLDTWTLGYRPRDLAHGTFPQLRGACLANYTSDPVFRSRLGERIDDPQAVVGHWAMTFGNPSLTWDDLTWLRGLTSLPIVLKGICAPQDVRRAVDHGVDAIQCSNHGGRQAASGAALSFLPEVVAAADEVPVLFDSGVRTGDDAVKALALGARMVGIGRPYGYAAADGAEGIAHALRCLLAEVDLTMGLNGYASLAAVREAGALLPA